jgi:hypothetical protein
MIQNKVSQKKKEQNNNTEKFHIIDNFKENICDSYPPKVVVPKLISLKHLREIAAFRARNRFPILSYIFQNGHKEVYLWRSGQVKMGLFNNRSYQDEFFVDLMDNVTKHQVNINRTMNSSSRAEIFQLGSNSCTNIPLKLYKKKVHYSKVCL